MAGPVETITAITCATLSIWCPEEAPPEQSDPGQIAPGFYREVGPPETKATIPEPARLVLPGPIDFGAGMIGDPGKAQRFELANAGGMALAINAVEITGSDAFKVDHNCKVVAPGDACFATVVFKPQLVGKTKGAVLIATPGDFKRVNLTGTGFAKTVARVRKPPPPAPMVVVKRPEPKKVPEPDPGVEATIRSLGELVSAGPTVFDGAQTAPLQPMALPTNEQLWKLEDQNYEGDASKGAFDKNVSTYPVERCRIIPTGTFIPLVLDSPINSQICGPVLAHVASDVYGPDGRIRLLKAGTGVEGACEPLDDPDASRIEVKFSKLTRPDGAVIELAEAQGADAMGQFGLVGEKFDRFVEKYAPTAIATTIGAVVAYLTAPDTNDDGTTVDSPLSAAGESFNQNIAQIVAEELRNATNRKRRIRIKKGTLIHIKPTNYWYFPNPQQIVEVDEGRIELSYHCSDGAQKSDEGRRQNPEYRP